MKRFLRYLLLFIIVLNGTISIHAQLSATNAGVATQQQPASTVPVLPDLTLPPLPPDPSLPAPSVAQPTTQPAPDISSLTALPALPPLPDFSISTTPAASPAGASSSAVPTIPTPVPVPGTSPAVLLSQWKKALTSAGYNPRNVSADDLQTIVESFSGIDPTAVTAAQLKSVIGQDLPTYLATLSGTGGATPGAAVAPQEAAQTCPAPKKFDSTPCGMISAACSKGNNMNVGTLIGSFLPPLKSLFNAIPPIKKWLKSATLYNFKMGQDTVAACNAFGYFTEALGAAPKGQFRGFEPGRTVTALSGVAHIDGAQVEVKVRFDGSTLNQNAFGFGMANTSLLIGLPKIDKKIKFSSISPFFKALDDLEIIDACVVFSTRDYQEEEWDTFIQQGVTILARIATGKGAIGKMVKSTGFSGATITLKGYITADFVGSYFSVEIDKTMKMGLLGRTKGMLRFTVYFEQAFPGVPVPTIAIGIAAGFTVKLPKCSHAVDVVSEVRLNIITTQITYTAWMEGFVQFDKVKALKPFKIGNLVIAFGTNLQQAAESAGFLTPAEYFMGGTIGIGDKELLLYGGVNTTFEDPEFILDGEFVGGITLRDIVALACDAMKVVGIKVNPKEIDKGIPKLGIKTLKVYICTRTCTYAGRTYRQGFEVLGEVIFFGATIGIDVALVPSEGRVTAAMWISKFALGPLYVTGRGMDMRWGTPDDGPVVRLEINVMKEPYVSFFVSGLVDVRIDKLELVRALIDFFIAPVGLALEMDCKILGIIDAYVVLNAIFVPIHELPGIGEAVQKASASVATSVIGRGAEEAGEGAAKGAAETAEKSAERLVKAKAKGAAIAEARAGAVKGLISHIVPPKIVWPLKTQLEAAIAQKAAADLRAVIDGKKIDLAFLPFARIPISRGLVKDVAKLAARRDELLQKYLPAEMTRQNAMLKKYNLKNPDPATLIAARKKYPDLDRAYTTTERALSAARKQHRDLDQAYKAMDDKQAQLDLVREQLAAAEAGMNQAKAKATLAVGDLATKVERIQKGWNQLKTKYDIKNVSDIDKVKNPLARSTLKATYEQLQAAQMQYDDALKKSKSVVYTVAPEGGIPAAPAPVAAPGE